MTAETDPADDPDTAETVGHDLDAERTTAPMSEFGSTELVVGFVVLVLGIVVTFGVPLLVAVL